MKRHYLIIHKHSVLTAAVLALSLLTTAKAQAETVHTLPYSCPFDTEEEVATWTSVDTDGDGKSWYAGNADQGGLGAQSRYSNSNDVDNSLISPSIALEAGKEYKLSFTAYTSYYNNENLDVTFGSSEDLSTHTTLISEVVCDYYGKTFEIPLPEIQSSGNYHISFRHYLERAKGFLITIKDVLVQESDEGSVQGIVTNSAGTAIQDVKVSIAGLTEQTTNTDGNGAYSFNNIPIGNYTLTASKYGYEIYQKEIRITSKNISTENISLEELKKIKVTGLVTDNQSTPLAGAIVKLSGYSDYITSTDASGNYTIDGVYISAYDFAPYDLLIEKNLMEDYSEEITLTGGSDIATRPQVKLAYKGVAPLTVSADTELEKAHVSWSAPMHLREHYYDNGSVGDAIGYDNGRETNIIGAIYRTPMMLRQVKWWTVNSYGHPEQLLIYIMELDNDGEPTGTITRQVEVDNTPERWSYYTFDEPISCPNGCMIAISTTFGNISLASDTGEDVVSGHKYVFSNFYNDPTAYRYFDDTGHKGGVLLRAIGENIESAGNQVPMTYSLYRFKSSDLANTRVWQQLTASTTDTEYTDTEWKSLESGMYRYAVTATYTIDGVTSPATVTDALENKMRSSLTVTVTTDSGNDADAEGAAATLTDKDGNSTHSVVSDGTAIFTNMPKGEYTLRVCSEGFHDSETALTLSDDYGHDTSCWLKQITAPVANIDYIDESRTLTWDFFADFEESFDGSDFSDFEINAPGRAGWSYIDNDFLLTYGFAGTTFPGMGSRMAAIVLNGKTTEPQMTQETGHTGDRALACFAAKATSGEGDLITYTSDDYIITPELGFHRDFTFSFFARTYIPESGVYERVRVGYSTTGKNLEDFKFVSEYTTVPETYTEYSFDIPKEAKYVTINSSSQDGFLLLIDDITLSTGIKHSGEAPSRGAFEGYRVTIDGEQQTLAPEQTSLKLDDIEEGQHSASVVKLFKSGESTPIDIEFTVTSAGIVEIGNGNPQISIAYDGADISVRADSTIASVRIYNVAGSTVISTSPDCATASIPTGAFAKGLYIVEAKSASGTDSKAKVIVR